jgi:hypothetical protein
MNPCAGALGKPGTTRAVARGNAFEDLKNLPERGLGFLIVAQEESDDGRGVVRHERQRPIYERLGDHQGASGELSSLQRVTGHPDGAGDEDQRPGKPAIVAQLSGQVRSFPEMRQAIMQVSEGI